MIVQGAQASEPPWASSAVAGIAARRRLARRHPLLLLFALALAYAFAWLLLVPAMLGARGLIPVTVPPVLLIFPLGYTPALAALAVAWLGDGPGARGITSRPSR